MAIDPEKMRRAIESDFANYERNKDAIRAEIISKAQNNLSSMSHWYPKISKVIRTPETILIPISLDAQWFLIEQTPATAEDEVLKIIEEVATVGKRWGYPLFLKSGMFSGKHNWKYTCYVPDEESIRDHIANIFHDQFLVGCEESLVLAARKVIKTVPAFTAFGDAQLPITKERRYFVEEGKVVFHQPYWPPHSIRDPSVEDWQYRLGLLNYESKEEVSILALRSEKIAKILGGSWSVDWLQDKDERWYLIDMAESRKSFKWEDYPFGTKYL
jgi:hypothetical protein